jgi:hypothetical protein
MGMPFDDVTQYSGPALKPTCARRIRGVATMLDHHATSQLRVPAVVIAVGLLLLAIAVLNLAIVLADVI